MNAGDATCWTLIRGAADGSAEAKEAFARSYAPAVRAYLLARWAGSPLCDAVDDAHQEVFLDCFRQGGALGRVDEQRPGGFRAFLYGIARIVALRFERHHATRRESPPAESLDAGAIEAEDARLSHVFDRAWARALMKEAADRQAVQAKQKGKAAERRVELLHLRFYENRPIREIAALWDEDAAVLHNDYAQARKEFMKALYEVVAFHHPGTRAEITKECQELIALLG